MRTMCLTAMLFMMVATSALQGQVVSFSRVDTTVVLLPECTVIALADSLIASGSDSVVLHGKGLLRGRDYLCSYTTGEIRLLQALPDTVTLAITYCYMPLFSQKRFSHQSQRVFSEDDSTHLLVPVVRHKVVPLVDDENDLVLYGSKTFGLSMGSQNAFAVEQALNLNIRGTVARDVKITASLSDQNTPIPPEGNTRTLRELDGVKIRAEGRHASVDMGNLYVTYTGTEYAQYHKRLEGAKAALTLPHVGLSACGALSEGEFTSVSFVGTDGKQGPYFLPGAGGELGFNILPGTEKIWVDGEPMVRGRENDYVIVYGEGSITFTNHKLITGESRIVADYEYFQGAYRRNFYSGTGYLKLWRDKIIFKTTIVHEGDDAHKPLELGAFNDTITQILSAAGDNPLKAYDPLGAIRLDSLGAYYFRGDTLVDTLVGAGTHSVSFSYVGEGKGDYSYDPGMSRYRFVGRGAGTYLPVLLLPLPQRRMLVDFYGEFHPFSFATLSGELALTEEDKNTLSRIDDDDNIGMASKVMVVVSPDSMVYATHYIGTYRLDGTYRKIGSRFAPPGRSVGVEEYERQWSIVPQEGITLSMLDGVAVYKYRNVLTVGGELGQLKQCGESEHLRRKGYITTAFSRLPQVALTWQDAGTRSKEKGAYWERTTGKGTYALGYLVPEGGYEYEYYSGVVQRHFDDTETRNYGITGYTVGLGTRGGGGGALAGVLRYTTRTGDQYETPYFDARTIVLQGALRDWKNLSGTFEFTRRDKERFEGVGVGTNRTYLALAKTEYAPFKRALIADVRYDVTSIQNVQKKEIFRKDEVYGEYRYEIDPLSNDTLWSIDAEGDYIREYVPIGEYRPAVEVKGRTLLSLVPRRLEFFRTPQKNNMLKQAIRSLSATTYITFGQTSLAKQYDVALFYPQTGVLDTALVFRREQTLRQDLSWDPAGIFSLRFQYRVHSLDDWEHYVGGLVRYDKERSVRVRMGQSSLLSNETKFILRTEKDTRGSSRSIISGRELESTLFRKSSNRTDMSVGIQYRTDTEEISALTSSMYAVNPVIRHSIASAGKITLDIEAVNVTDSTASYRQLAGNRQGWSYRFNALLDYRVNKYMTYYVTYQFADEPYLDEQRRITQQGRAEVRATF